MVKIADIRRRAAVIAKSSPSEDEDAVMKELIAIHVTGGDEIDYTDDPFAKLDFSDIERPK